MKNIITEPCKECPKGNGIEVFSKTSMREYTYAPQIYGHYQLQSGIVNGRVYFKKGEYAIWWDGANNWNIGLNSSKGSNRHFSYFTNDVLCPHQIKEWNGELFDGEEHICSGELLALRTSNRGNVLISIDSHLTYYY